MKKKLLAIIILTFMVLLLFGCSKGKSNNGDSAIKNVEDNQDPTLTPTPSPTAVPTVTDTVEVPEDTSHEGEMRSYLTGQWVPVEIGLKRPYAIQFNNYKVAANQSGVSQADILYEALVEGGITRILGIGENYTGDRLGSVRSSRHYFASIADEYDAIYVHYGKTKYAKAKLAELGINNLDGETGIGDTVFYRDKNIKSPHNAFTSVEKILKGIEKKGYETNYSEGYQPHFSFYNEDTELTSDSSASKITIGFSSYNSPYLQYNSEDKLYYRFQFGAPHIDSVTGNQLTFKNIIIWFVKESDIDRNDYQTMDFTNASGSGYYITNGKMVPITWKKKESESWMRFYNEAGEELSINPGKTYIALFPNNRTEDVEIKK